MCSGLLASDERVGHQTLPILYYRQYDIKLYPRTSTIANVGLSTAYMDFFFFSSGLTQLGDD